MEKIGKILTCNRCGKEIFLEHKGGKSTDGGFTWHDSFQSKPLSWSVEKGCDLCKECTADYNSLWTKFIREKGRNL